MKSKLFAFLAALLAFGAVSAPKAEAGRGYYRSSYSEGGYYVTRIVGYDECGAPVYRRFWVDNCPPPVRYVAPCPPPVRYVAPCPPPRYYAPPRVSIQFSTGRGGYCPPHRDYGYRGGYGGGGGHRRHR